MDSSVKSRIDEWLAKKVKGETMLETTNELAKRLGVKGSQVREYIQQRGLDELRKHGKLENSRAYGLRYVQLPKTERTLTGRMFEKERKKGGTRRRKQNRK